jgi:hypothetical protein
MKKSILATAALTSALILAGCATAPTPDASSTTQTFDQPIEAVHKSAINALVVTGFDVEKNEPSYIEGFRPRKIGLFVGSGGETVGVWLKPVDASATAVTVDTARSFTGYAGQKVWNSEVLSEMSAKLRKQ